MNRTKFFNKVTVDDVEQLDFLYNTLSKFSRKRVSTHYRTTVVDRKRPDLISYKNFGTVRYWWLICLINGLDDPFFDTAIDLVLEIPNILDISDFHKRYRVQR